jgi:preprotein translocase subunit SecG
MNPRLRILMIVVLLLCGFVLLSPSVLSLGIGPGEKTVVYNSEDITYNLRIVNDDKVTGTFTVDAAGELAKYMTFSKTKISFTAQKADEVISVKLSIPQDVKIPVGEYTLRITVKADESNGAGVTAFVGVISKLIVTIPGDSANVAMHTYVPNFVRGEKNSFSVEIVNKGITPATNCFAVVDIITSSNAKVISLISNRVNVQGTRMETLLLPWIPDVNNGKYIAKTSVICDGVSLEDEKTFSIGSATIKVVNFVSTGFELGEINRFDLILQSEWGETISNVYADIELAKDEITLTRTKTETIDILGMEKMSVPVYLDTNGMTEGKYSMYIMLHYLDKSVGEIYSVQMTANTFVIDKLSGMVVTGNSKDEGAGGTNSLLIMVIVIVVILNVVLVMKLLKRKEDKKQT